MNIEVQRIKVVTAKEIELSTRFYECEPGIYSKEYKYKEPDWEYDADICHICHKFIQINFDPEGNARCIQMRDQKRILCIECIQKIVQPVMDQIEKETGKDEYERAAEKIEKYNIIRKARKRKRREELEPNKRQKTE